MLPSSQRTSRVVGRPIRQGHPTRRFARRKVALKVRCSRAYRGTLPLGTGFALAGPVPGVVL
jgi:hypothetical protein